MNFILTEPVHAYDDFFASFYRLLVRVSRVLNLALNVSLLNGGKSAS